MKNTKEKILQKSLDLFVKKGFSGSSIRDIAKEVGIRESGIYNHFSSKKQILTEIINKLLPKSLPTLILTDELLDEISNPELFIRNYAKKIFENWNSESERALIKIILSEQFHENTDFEISFDSYYAEYFNITKMIFSEMMKHKFIKKGNADILTDNFLSFLFIQRFKNIDSLTNKDVTRKIEEYAKFFWESIKK